MISPSQRPLPDNTQHSQQTNIHAPGGIRTHDRSRRAAVDLRLRLLSYRDRPFLDYPEEFIWTYSTFGSFGAYNSSEKIRVFVSNKSLNSCNATDAAKWLGLTYLLHCQHNIFLSAWEVEQSNIYLLSSTHETPLNTTSFSNEHSSDYKMPFYSFLCHFQLLSRP